MQVGSLDYSTQSHCAGWAVSDGQPALPTATVNGIPIASRLMRVDRPDLASHGLPVSAGFILKHPEPLGLDDVLEVWLPNGQPVSNSPNTQHRERLANLLTGISKTDRGLEFGVLDRPILSKSLYTVYYVDHASRAELLSKYDVSTATTQLDLQDVREVDIVWNSGSLKAIAPGPFDYCLASHVLEHIADPIGWLGEVAAVLRPGGRLNLAIPEMTRTFDRFRSPSTPAAMLDAHRRQLTRPAFSQVFDHVLGVVPIGEPPSTPAARAIPAYNTAMKAEQSGQYLDVHCHVWSHEMFAHCWDVIDHLTLTPLRLEAIHPPIDGYNEFTVAFSRR